MIDIKVLGSDDYLGKAAVVGHLANNAVKDGRYDEAWKLFHEQKEIYLKHASKLRFDRSHTLSLEGSVHEHLANILRLEAKHEQALVHIVYWVATSRQSIKRHDSKFRAYFSRCKFSNVDLQHVKSFCELVKKEPDFRTIQSTIMAWKK